MWRSASGVKMTSTKDHSGLRAPRRRSGSPRFSSGQESAHGGPAYAQAAADLALAEPVLGESPDAQDVFRHRWRTEANRGAKGVRYEILGRGRTWRVRLSMTVRTLRLFS
jgi:hypothetical protein